MSFFNPNEPILRCKQAALDVQDLRGLLKINWQIGNFNLFSAFYTRIDQVFVIWGIITAAIFITAQFFPISWGLQAILWSVLTIGGAASMVALAWFWVQVEQLRWVIYTWVILMLFGIILTDLGIYLAWGEVLIRLCPLWLGLSALGYFCTGWGLQSRSFMIAGMIHLLAISLLPYVLAWQFAATGVVMAATLLFLAEVQWDMRPPAATALLTIEEKQFNLEQQRIRQAESY